MPAPSNRPSVVIHGFTGGIVHSATAALRLAEVVLQSPAAPHDWAACSPLHAHDRGDRWLVAGAGGDAASVRKVEIRKLDAAVLSLDGQRPPQVLGTAAVVEKVAAILAESTGDSGESRLQSPFTVTDNGDFWLVRGSRNVDRAVEGPGPFHLEVRKRDGAVLDLYFEGVLHTPREVTEMLRRKK